MKLVAIHYKYGKEPKCLYSIQMEFANGLKSPLFETRDARDDKTAAVNTIQIEQNLIIRQIGVKMKGIQIIGLKLIDHNEEVYAEHIWGSKYFGNWVIQKIPFGHEIIGLQCCTRSYSFCIPILCFVLRLPNPALSLKLL